MTNQVLSIDQCKELVALGIDMSKASMYWRRCMNYITDEWDSGTLMIGSSIGIYPSLEFIPTFTLQDISEICPKVIRTEEDNFELYLNTYQCYAQYRDSKHNKMLNIEFGNSILEAAFNMLKWLKENKYI